MSIYSICHDYASIACLQIPSPVKFEFLLYYFICHTLSALPMHVPVNLQSIFTAVQDLYFIVQNFLGSHILPPLFHAKAISIQDDLALEMPSLFLI